ncbi:MAG: Uncharacterized protein G01um101430_360 [Parcubacteria group bacterium Gr01-1014_30]|nr:MAG: Uncharacterized protein G01um101430_360 [Parcubacteria group bacterium Gr01-1014_30]
MLQKVKGFIFQHKVVTGVIVAVLLVVGWQAYRAMTDDSGETRYVLAQVQKGTLSVSVSGTGQVEAGTQVDLKPKIAGEVARVPVRTGEPVKAGTLLVQFDSRDAQLNLENEKLALDKLKLEQGQRLRGDVLNKVQEEGMSELAGFYGEFLAILDDLDDIFFGTEISGKSSEDNITYYAKYAKQSSLIPARAKNLFDEIQGLHQSAISEFEGAQRGGNSQRTSAIQKGAELASKTAELIKLGRDAVRAVQDFIIAEGVVHRKQTTVDSHGSDLADYALAIDDYLQSLLALANTINGELDDLESQPLELKAQELAVLEAQNKLADYYLRAPFDGVIGRVDVKAGEQVSLADTLAVLITSQKFAEIPLNEIDAARVLPEQEATLTFDALTDLEIKGQVAEVDVVGDVSQGVVTYDVKIAFESADSRIKPSMSVSADIVTQTKTDVLMVPNSAVKTQGNVSYVELPEGAGRRNVQVGISSDEFTEIVAGLQEGESVVARILQGSSAAPQNSGFPFGGSRTVAPGGGGNRVFISH